MTLNLTGKSSITWLLPLMAALLVESFIQHAMLDAQSYFEAFKIVAQLILESMPMLLAHLYLAKQGFSGKGMLVWVMSFIVYPIVCLIFASVMPMYSDFTILTDQGVSILAGFSFIYILSQWLQSRQPSSSLSVWVSRLLSLNGFAAIIVVFSALIFSLVHVANKGIFDSGTVRLVISSEQLANAPWEYFTSFIQFLIIGILLSSVYVVNRYVLIRIILSTHGLVAYISAAIVFVLMFTPVFGDMILWLPINNGETSLLLSGDDKVFTPINYRAISILFLITTPVILLYERQSNEKRLLETEKENVASELKVLREQINPHFLFNTLSSVYAKALQSDKDTPELILKLSNMLRHSVYDGDKTQVSLQDEVQYIKDYLDLQCARLGKRCNLVFECSPDIEEVHIPPMLLIVPIENAFKHGDFSTGDEINLSINIQVDGEQIILHCENSLANEQGPKDEVGGVGLRNLSRRLALLLPGNHKLEYFEKGTKWITTLTLKIAPK